MNCRILPDLRLMYTSDLPAPVYFFKLRYIHCCCLSSMLHSAEFPVAITAFKITSGWGSIETEGPLHCVLDVKGYPAEPFSYGTFQNAFKAFCVVPNKFLELGTKYVLKQQKIEGQIVEANIDSLFTEDIDAIDAECERQSVKVTQ